MSVAGYLSVSSNNVWAESADLPDPVYHNLRYTDDFCHPPQQYKTPDLWERFKCIPIGDGKFGPTFLTLGGEWRERFESYVNPNFGIKAPARNAYLLQRLLVNADLHITSYFRTFVQLGDLRRVGERGVTSTTDNDMVDLMQAFVDFTPPTPFGDAPTFRYGREELLFGFQRLIAVREGPNVRRAFDGVRFSDHMDGASIDLVAVHPVSNYSGAAFDDATNFKQTLIGAYATLPIGPVLKTDLYWLDYENDAAKYRGLSGVEERRTLGARAFGELDGFDWNLEAAAQTGTFRNHDIRAQLLAGVVGYTFRGAPWTPRIEIEANDASGDNSHSSTIGTFNAMYPRLPYFAETSLLVPANVKDVRPVFSFNPVEDVQATFGWDTLWRASTTDGLYGSAMVEYPGTAKATGSRVGTEWSADVRWKLDQHLTVGAIAAEFLAGPAVEQALGKNVTFLVAYAKYRF
ncbi:MAG: alginate export family protein [Roseiarcus sp.]